MLKLSDGSLVRRIGSQGSGPAQFDSPYGLCVLPDEQLAVCDTGNNRIQIVSFDGKFIRELTA